MSAQSAALTVDDLVDRFPRTVGARVKEVRQARKWTLDHLAEASNVSRRTIVNIESGSSSPSITTLLRLATALQVTLADLVAEDVVSEPVTVTTAAARRPLWRGDNGGFAELVASADLPDMLEHWNWSLKPDDRYDSEPHRWGTHELIHVASGTLTLIIDGQASDLHAGDGARFAAHTAHSYANLSRKATVFTMTVFEPVTRLRP